MEINSKILVTGASGMVGSAVVRELIKNGYENLILTDKKECDLIDKDQTRILFGSTLPEYVFHIAAKVGGINANNTKKADFIYENLMIQNNVINTSYLAGVKKLIFCGSACIYPKNSPQPIKEEYLLTGTLEETNKPYAVAKIAGVTMCDAYRDQYGCDFISVMPTNLYGIGDNFNLQNSHVMPALIRKMHEAKVNNKLSVEVWGTGTPSREFLYADDLANALVFLMNKPTTHTLVNIGTGQDIPIKELVDIIKQVVGYEGSIKWNSKYPDGVMQRRLDVSKMTKMGWEARTPLVKGIYQSYEWYLKSAAG